MSSYTSKEDKKILMYIQNEHLDERDTKYTELAKLLRRTSRSIFKRYRYLKKIQDESKTGRSNFHDTFYTIEHYTYFLLLYLDAYRDILYINILSNV